jgi:two-component system, NtrC family, response regulator HydG
MRATANLSNLFRFKMFAGGDVPVAGLQSRVGMQADPALVVASRAMTELLSMAERAAQSPAKVLITGESGVGKDLVARFIHSQSTRRSGPFVAVNCAGLTETLLEYELFGHVKGSFTGAYRDKRGRIQLAHRGTLLLDEVGEMSLRMQALLLRFLENGEIQAVGSDQSHTRVDVRVVAATNRDLGPRCRRTVPRGGIVSQARPETPPVYAVPADAPVDLAS